VAFSSGSATERENDLGFPEMFGYKKELGKLHATNRQQKKATLPGIRRCSRKPMDLMKNGSLSIREVDVEMKGVI
jgi:hypothetical protein